MQPVQNEGIGAVEQSHKGRGQIVPEPLLLKVEEAARSISARAMASGAPQSIWAL
jgi:hypothetical protein